MPWCPNCEEEYIDGVMYCPECGEPLTESLPEGAPEDESLEPVHVEERLLLVTETEVDYAVIADALEKEGIPFITRAHGIWESVHILSGHSSSGQEIYVADHDYAKAREIADYFRELKDAPGE